MKTVLRLVVAILAIVGAAAVASGLWLMNRGISTRLAPGPLETRIARAARHAAVPAPARSRTNPVRASADVIKSGREHWADHCAACHANDGSGNTEMGRGLYPRVPDMRHAETQQLTDGELFYIIENGVRLTGMPAWGTATEEGELASWHLVHFIRHLPSLTPEEVTEMEELNPRSPEEWREREEERKFLEGAGDAPSPDTDRPKHEHKGGQE